MMNPSHAVGIANDSSRMARILAEWYSLNPDVRRLWLYEAGESQADGARDMYVVVDLTPVCDSDDTSPIWLARCSGWQGQLQSLVGVPVHVQRFDGDIEVAPCAEGTEDGRVCLARVAWRDCCTAE